MEISLDFTRSWINDQSSSSEAMGSFPTMVDAA